jgi:hypothetical protein
VKNLASDFRSVSTAVYSYQDRFRALPGDDRSAEKHVNGGTNATGDSSGNARINGPWDSSDSAHESYLFWQHIRLAGLIAGTPDTKSADYLPRNVEGGRIGVTGEPILNSPSTPYPASFYVCSQGIQGRYARQIDTTLDDGNTGTGSVRAISDGATTETIEILPQNDAVLYTVCQAF